ncbi:MAG TPA: ABC-type transport auxiliary lipoprotein family protein [Lamprocystis sp. (in: g-proteobacteria)]|nr:ABC-type transport auxiliary lipoprotein family protein [Lamprocystis sp. (in: g-proteobacteria)]
MCSAQSLRIFALLFTLAGLTGCSIAPPAKPDRFYRLAPEPLAGPVGAPAPAILLVNTLAARGFLGGRDISFRTREAPLIAQRYEELLWEDPPPQSLARALESAIRTARVFAFVVVPAERARADYLLGGEVERFEHLPTDQPPRVAVTFRLALVRADDRNSMVSRDYSGEEPVAATTPDAMVAAFNRLSARLIAQAVRDLQSIKPRLSGAARR